MRLLKINNLNSCIGCRCLVMAAGVARRWRGEQTGQDFGIPFCSCVCVLFCLWRHPFTGHGKGSFPIKCVRGLKKYTCCSTKPNGCVSDCHLCSGTVRSLSGSGDQNAPRAPAWAVLLPHVPLCPFTCKSGAFPLQKPHLFNPCHFLASCGTELHEFG